MAPMILNLGTRWELSGQFTPGEKAPGTHCIGDWVGPKDSLDTVANRKKSSLPPAGNPAHNLVTILTELSRPCRSYYVTSNIRTSS
jgi:hypothetical protein